MEFNITTVGWEDEIDIKDAVYRGKNATIKDAMQEKDSRIILSKGIVPGSNKKGDLGHVAGLVVRIYRHNRHVLTIQFLPLEWDFRGVPDLTKNQD